MFHKKTFEKTFATPQDVSVVRFDNGEDNCTEFRFHPIFQDEVRLVFADRLQNFEGIRFEGPFARRDEMVFRIFGSHELREAFTSQFERAFADFLFREAFGDVQPAVSSPKSKLFRVTFKGLDRPGLLMDFSELFDDHSFVVLQQWMSSLPPKWFVERDFSNRQQTQLCRMLCSVEIPVERVRELPTLRRELEEMSGGSFRFAEVCDAFSREIFYV